MFYQPPQTLLAQDRKNYEYDRRGLPIALPYCIVNADRFRLETSDISKHLHLCPEYLQQEWNEVAAVKDFFDHIDPVKQLWRKADIHKNVVYLKTEETGSLKNTGGRPLRVGEPFYAFPAIATMAAMNPSVNLFRYKDKTYMHPYFMGAMERQDLLEDIIKLCLNGHEEEYVPTKTHLGSVIARVGKSIDTTDLNKLFAYIQCQSAVGLVLCTMEAAHRTYFTDQQAVVPLGSDFIARYNNLAYM